jgi:hypothetical protein
MQRERFLYRGPVEKLADRLARLEQLRQHVHNEQRSLERFLAANPDLRTRLPSCQIRPRLHVIDGSDKGGPSAAN